MKNLVVWIDIPTQDHERAVKFYNAVFKLDLKATGWGQEKMACFPTGDGSISYAPDFKPSENGTLVSLQVSDNIKSTLERIVENGGKIIQTKTKIEAEGRGFFAIFMDCEGNKVGLYGDE